MVLSVVIPFYKKLDELKFSFETYNLQQFKKHNAQLVIVVDDPEQSEELKKYLYYVSKEQNLKIKMLLNPNSHEWRNPAKPLNVGIKNADGKKILVMSPESCFASSDAISKLVSNCDHYKFSHGDIKFCTYKERKEILAKGLPLYENINSQIIPYGSICFLKEHAWTLGAYDESRGSWGGEDDNFRNRLMKAGIQKVYVEAHLIHFQELPRSETAKKIDQEFPSDYYEWRNNPSIIANTGGWGNDFNTIALLT
ncbi:hypothetical protein AYK24_00095 [Thermoplasmatales archaeon SG8-52-4]|nr:MAG: hypothetical protein AYK24_00095 [Thermoplasmatales archaeon SG8-52-4]